jgi:hypothetical protein
MLALVAGAAPALAQDGKAPESKAPTSEERQLIARYATCLFDISGYKFRTVVDLPFGDTASVNGMYRLLDPNCVPSTPRNEVRFRSPSLVVLRGSLYEELYRQDFGKAPAIASFDDTPSPAYPLSKTRPQYAVAYRVAMDFGECVVRAAPSEARALVLSPVATPAESEAIRAITPALGTCVDAGQSMELSRSVVRGAVAEALYRLSRLRQAQPAGAK